MNARTPTKYRALSELLDTLAEFIGNGRIAVSERWRDNEEALGLHLPGNPRHAAFVFTFGQPPGRYGVDLDFPELADIAAAGVPLVQEELTLARLLEVLKTHFDMSAHA